MIKKEITLVDGFFKVKPVELDKERGRYNYRIILMGKNKAKKLPGKWSLAMKLEGYSTFRRVD